MSIPLVQTSKTVTPSGFASIIQNLGSTAGKRAISGDRWGSVEVASKDLPILEII